MLIPNFNDDKWLCKQIDLLVDYLEEAAAKGENNTDEIEVCIEIAEALQQYAGC